MKQGCTGRCKRKNCRSGAWGWDTGGWGRARPKMWEQGVAGPERGEAVRKWECHQTTSFSFQWYISVFFDIDMNQIQGYYSYY